MAENHEGWRREFGEFLQRLEIKVERGAQEYGDASFNLPADRISEELEQELLDIAGWGFILWVRMQRLKDRLRGIEVNLTPNP